MADRVSYIKAAFLAPANLILLGGAAVFAGLATSLAPLLVALGVECLYLALLPSLPGYQRLVRRRHEKERREREERQLASLLGELSPSQKEHYLVLRGLRDSTLENYRRLPGGEALVETSLARLDGLLVSFLRLLGALNGYRRYLSTTDRAALQSECDELQAELAGGQAGGDALRSLKERRTQILEQRLARLSRATEGRELISHQLASVEDFLRLLYEQSLTLRDPASLGAQLEHLSAEIEATDETVKQMEKFMEMSEELPLLTPPDRQQVR